VSGADFTPRYVSDLYRTRTKERRRQYRLGDSRQTRKGESTELDERLTPKPSSSRVSSQWKSWVKSQRKSTRADCSAVASRNRRDDALPIIAHFLPGRAILSDEADDNRFHAVARLCTV
jgi:hypothetical protein